MSKINQPEWLSPEEYQMIIAPSLKVAAELAASRGDPTLLQDLPSMLCLIHMVDSLKSYYVDEWLVMNGVPSEESLQNAAEAACMMVLTEGNVPKNYMPTMISALNRAYQQVIAEGISVESDAVIKRAWESVKKNENAQFLALLEQAAKKFVLGIDAWEKSRNGH